MSDSEPTQLDEDQEQLLTAALLEKLRLTPDERVIAHEAALALFRELALAGEKQRAESK